MTADHGTGPQCTSGSKDLKRNLPEYDLAAGQCPPQQPQKRQRGPQTQSNLASSGSDVSSRAAAGCGKEELDEPQNSDVSTPAQVQTMPQQYTHLNLLDVPAAGGLPAMRLARLTADNFAAALSVPQVMASLDIASLAISSPKTLVYIPFWPQIQLSGHSRQIQQFSLPPHNAGSGASWPFGSEKQHDAISGTCYTQYRPADHADRRLCSATRMYR